MRCRAGPAVALTRGGGLRRRRHWAERTAVRQLSGAAGALGPAASGPAPFSVRVNRDKDDVGAQGGWHGSGSRIPIGGAPGVVHIDAGARDAVSDCRQRHRLARPAGLPCRGRDPPGSGSPESCAPGSCAAGSCSASAGRPPSRRFRAWPARSRSGPAWRVNGGDSLSMPASRTPAGIREAMALRSKAAIPVHQHPKVRTVFQ